MYEKPNGAVSDSLLEEMTVIVECLEVLNTDVC